MKQLDIDLERLKISERLNEISKELKDPDSLFTIINRLLYKINEKQGVK